MDSTIPWRTSVVPVKGLLLRWLSPREADAMRQQWLELWSQLPYPMPLHADCRARLERCIPVAAGPQRCRALSRTPSQLVLVFDPDAPDQVWLSLSGAMPSLLWPSAEPSRFGDGIAPYLATEDGAVARLPRVCRLVGQPGVDGLETIERVIDGAELWIDDACWGSAHDEDPWPHEKELTMLQQASLRRDTARQHGGRFPSLTHRTLWSRSILRIEQHPFGLFVFELRWAPVDDPRGHARVDELTRGRLPRDLPLDLAASLLHCDFSWTPDSAEQLAWMAAAAPGETSTTRALLDWSGGDVELLAEVAAQYRHEAVLFELAFDAPEPLRSRIRTVLTPGWKPSAAEETP